jgi:starch synthase
VESHHSEFQNPDKNGDVDMLKIIFVGSEARPFAKTGGLADVLGSLPAALAEEGMDVSLIVPFYRTDGKARFEAKLLPPRAITQINSRTSEFNIWMSTAGGVKTYLLDNEAYFARTSLYGDENGDYPDNWERFATFSMAALVAMKETGILPQVIHLHDWQTAVLPTYLKKFSRDFPKTKTLYTIHNLAYQGVFDVSLREKLDLPPEALFGQKLNFMKLGILSADMVSTVSEKFKEEILTEQFGFGLHEILKRRSEDLYGVLNGLDYAMWDPRQDREIYENYDVDSLEIKERNKAALEKELGLKYDSLPLVGMVSRLDSQKGFDLLDEALSDMLHLDLKLVILGTGDKKYQSMLAEKATARPNQMKAVFEFNTTLARRIYAGSDLFLMPSRFEPCGLTNLIALRYGTPPIVHRTGGLAETIGEFDVKNSRGNGFVFTRYSKKELLDVVKRAIETYRDKSAWRRLQQTGMKERFTWSLSAKKYSKLYQKLITQP